MGSLFAGIGGFDLGFERAGFKTVWQVEINEWCQRVLAKNFPDAERYADIRECGAHNLCEVDVVCGGFPCQDISLAGRGAGIAEGTRSGLWFEYARIIRELRPRFVLVENVAALLARGMDTVLADLAALGYDAEWEIVSAADVGAPHRRERVWILAYPQSEQNRRIRFCRVLSYASTSSELGNTSRLRCDGEGQGGKNESGALGGSSSELADAASLGQSRQRKSGIWRGPETNGQGEASKPLAVGFGDFWTIEPNVGRVAHGVPTRVDRLRGLGNAVVPQIPEMYARRIRELL